MNYIMERFDQVISSLSDNNRNNCIPKKEDTDSIIKDFALEKERIRLHIMEEVFNVHEEKTLQILIDKYQAIFIRLMDQIYVYRQSVKNDDYKTLAKALYEYLNELLSFLQVHYAGSFNRLRKLPIINMDLVKKEIKPKLQTIKIAFNKNILNEKLVALIVQPFEFFLCSQTITYAESQYIKIVSNEILTMASHAGQEDITLNLKKLLISINFNSPSLTAFLINELEIPVAEEESVQEKLMILKYQLKLINQVIVKPGYVLHFDHEPLKSQLFNWLNEEIIFYQTEQAVVAIMPNPVVSDTKIHTSLSVPQLALLFRLLKEEQLITNTNQSELLKVVSGCFTTIHRENFSYGHLHGKYYKIESHTKRTVYDMLMRLVHQSRKIG